MKLEITYESHTKTVNLSDEFDFSKVERKSEGNRRDNNLDCLLHDLSKGCENMVSYTLFNSDGKKIIDKWI